MSTKASITKNIYITSIDQLYKILDSNEDILSMNSNFTSFFDYMNDYYHGCKCNEEENLKLATQEYNTISISDECCKILLSYFSCETIKFAEL